MKVRWGAVTSEPFFFLSNAVRQGGILLPLLFSLYVDDLSQGLRQCKTGCLVGERLLNHLL